MSYFCNPINVPYRYQFNPKLGEEGLSISREGADPSIIYYHDRYYLFPSMNLSVWVSEDLVNWESHPLPKELPLYGYAPDASVIDDYIYFCSSAKSKNCDYYRTKDILKGPYEKIEGSFPFWDPHLFQDEDGRVYFYWGCSSSTPIWGVELDRETMKPIGEKKELIWSNVTQRGYERCGEDHCLTPRTEEEVEQAIRNMAEQSGKTLEDFDSSLIEHARSYLQQRPYIEGAWMTKYKSQYFLQYSSTGSELNVYNDGVFVSDSPLGPFELADNNPYSYKPGGFLPGAGHGSTIKDKSGNYWHAATSRIAVNHNFERRVGIWPAGFDEDGELYCDQRFGDWPINSDTINSEVWKNPEWMLLSYDKKVSASSYEKGYAPENVTDENIQTWWRAETEEPGQWIEIDLESVKDIRGIQINFADQDIVVSDSPTIITNNDSPRYIDESPRRTRWQLEGSLDGNKYELIQDKKNVDTDLPHDFMPFESSIFYRYLKLTIFEVPFHQRPCISGFRVFGKGEGTKPGKVVFTAQRTEPTSMKVKWNSTQSIGAVILWGHQENKLYHSYLVFQEHEKEIRSLIKKQPVYVRVDSFNEVGVTKGKVIKLEE